MIEEVNVSSGLSFVDYEKSPGLAQAIDRLRAEARHVLPQLSGRTVWMVNATPRGGGVAEMLPKQVRMLGELGLQVRWLVIARARPEFFGLTKRLHNLLHDSGDPQLGDAERELYEGESARLAEHLARFVRPRDVVVVHDPQPAAAGALLSRCVDVRTVWRCHIGLDEETQRTHAAWEFLRPYLESYDHSVFSATPYIPHYLAKNVSVIVPALDPLSHKNRELHPVKLTGILCNAGLMARPEPLITDPFPSLVSRLTPEGRFRSLDGATSIGLLFRPVVTQVSRWDRLKGFQPLLEGFARLKRKLRAGEYSLDERQLRRHELVRLVMAGPDPSGVADDPEAQQVLDQLSAEYRRLPRALQDDVAVLSLPMRSVKQNALIVNALQRSSSVVVQNSLREGFGLVVAEAMWKGTPVIGSSAYGIRQQIRDRIDGGIVEDPADPRSVERELHGALSDPYARQDWARTARRRVYDEFLVFKQLGRWLELLGRL